MERRVSTGNLFLLFGQLTSATLTNDLSDIFFQARPVQSMLNSLNRLVLAEVSSETYNMHFPREEISGTYGKYIYIAYEI